jgi:hypothetical protein
VYSAAVLLARRSGDMDRLLPEPLSGEDLRAPSCSQPGLVVRESCHTAKTAEA